MELKGYIYNFGNKNVTKNWQSVNSLKSKSLLK